MATDTKDLSDAQILSRIREMRQKCAWGELVVRFRAGKVPSLRTSEDVTKEAPAEDTGV